MAVSAAVFCLLLLFNAATTNENTTSYNLNTTLGDQNVTFDFMENYTTPQPTEFESTSPTPSSTSTEPPQPTEPLPAEPLPTSGRLPTPVTTVDSVCPCDLHESVCDINCCCDRVCAEELSLFTSCSVDRVSGSQQLCSGDVVSYSLRITIDGYSELQASAGEEPNYDILCIQSQNRVGGLSHPPPALPTDSSFDSLFKEFTSFMFGSEERQVSSAELQDSSGYQYGEVMLTADRGVFLLPAAAITADCVDSSPAGFLKDQSSVCSRRVTLQQHCSSLPPLSMNTYTDIQLLAGKNEDAAVVPVQVCSVVLQSVEGTQTELQISDGGDLPPALLDPSLCANVVLKVAYVVKYSPAGDIVNVSVALVLGFVSEAELTLEQEFHITFVQEDGGGGAVHSSGNPGYVVGLPLVSGTRTAEYPLPAWATPVVVLTGIVGSLDPRDTLSLLLSAEQQDCLRGPQQRAPILFAVDSVSGCTLRLEDAANCSLVQQLLLDVLRGPNPPQHVASFGNSLLDSPMDWLPIKNNLNPGEAQSCSIPLSLHLEVQWTQYGSLMNPQAQIVSIKEIIQTNTTSLEVLSAGSSTLSISSSVAFIPVSAAALPGYRATPTIDAKLPFDFFFPFV
ncbi:hypothetical protein CgunFtcFv8_018124 [Champsocephalus gunnari]|uniref:Tectonic-1 n=1 Tax=Champsocephalus gunnari TaxID=52237 RepID=A0AAN8HRX7_CHAGU|nr:hypothetical protein CgunFtcFv8_018124 [Champsocephalus gunnari]